MSDNLVFSLEQLETADLLIDARYAGGRKGNASDDPLTKLLSLSNGGGFRIRGTYEDPRLIVLTSSMEDLDWPDNLDLTTGVFTYYGDNKKPGRKLNETPRRGNFLLELVFSRLNAGERDKIPPILIFTKAGIYRDVVFRGLAIPGAIGSTHNDDLVAVWHTTAGQRFQNYRATFTVLNLQNTPRAWLNDIIHEGVVGVDSKHAPTEWLKWIKSGQYTPLIAKRSQPVRSKLEQLPSSTSDKAMLAKLHQHFQSNSYAFEHCAANLVRLCLPNTVELDLTRPFRDGGRDGIGKLRIGRPETSVLVDFAIEAKCYGLGNSVGVREVSRLISRLRHRQFGVLVTTSWVNHQAYSEIVEDGHPVMILSGKDVIELLKESGLNTLDSLRKWLEATYPITKAT
ncbi:restriction endonuclease [Pseudomonas sp. VS40]|uniref:restriction endonuclease n=1 Tax=unclassified Pseudomonas TaxID=196821 RepID=UPI001BDED80B|nr:MULTISPECIES: restriction endonuclease [unclassified Pseudomonas]MBT1258941.1 restriction endonuclease [Pseudomonas sp. VS40]MBT1271423.1 restriction endonuclease [Pseudomonas sp. VS59]